MVIEWCIVCEFFLHFRENAFGNTASVWSAQRWPLAMLLPSNYALCWFLGLGVGFSFCLHDTALVTCLVSHFTVGYASRYFRFYWYIGSSANHRHTFFVCCQLHLFLSLRFILARRFRLTPFSFSLLPWFLCLLLSRTLTLFLALFWALYFLSLLPLLFLLLFIILTAPIHMRPPGGLRRCNNTCVFKFIHI